MLTSSFSILELNSRVQTQLLSALIFLFPVTYLVKTLTSITI
ncbi:hypothetical protein [Vibrio gallaecicus]|nr:hypothetical protein [Vibrio gallaecicus]MDN3616540.1 hypothetical protein [Vibrio gallaecicus]